MIKDLLFYFYGYVVFFYSMGLIISYVILMWLAEISIFRKKRGPLSLYIKQIIDKSPYTPGVSIIAPAYNEERTVVNNVNSLLGQDYPTFEVVIVNDGSTDKTLDLLIGNSSLWRCRSLTWNTSAPSPTVGSSSPRTRNTAALSWWTRRTAARRPMPSMPG